MLKPAPVVSANDKYSALRDLLGDDENVNHTDIAKNNDIIATDIAEDDDDFGEFVATPTVLPLQPIAPKSLLPGEDLNLILKVKSKKLFAVVKILKKSEMSCGATICVLKSYYKIQMGTLFSFLL